MQSVTTTTEDFFNNYYQYMYHRIYYSIRYANIILRLQDKGKVIRIHTQNESGILPHYMA